MGQGRSVSRFLELAEHLRVREDLARVTAGEGKEEAKKRRFVHPREQKHVTRDRRLNQRLHYVGHPTFMIPDKGGCSRVAAVEDVLFQRQAERGAHLTERP